MAAEPVFKLALSRPIKAHGATIEEISFREPTGGDIARFGNPVIFNPFAGDTPVFDADKMTAQLANLAAVNRGAIEELTSNDWTTCAWGVAGFFIPLPRKAAST